MQEEIYDLFKELSTFRKPMTVSDVANLAGISKQSVYEFIKNGSLRALQLGATIRLNPHDVAAWLEARANVPLPRLRAA
jgi:excisionase family DNA binding protein